ncbi:GntR family transcriptional regulator [Pantoea sp. BAV 3049]|uniref:GntR family transcriptional regulator n=1 Tax=Pantoea sp. BAV 3049 TaxID=2654188 RepID=UPI00131C6A4C|nr:GntR family transcriptional regulator [Pantoea sp. BAV 3049]
MKDFAPLLDRLKLQLTAREKKPLYQRFVAVIKNEVLQGSLRQDDILPSEREFSQQLQISRITVRKALAELEKEGVVVRARGYGTQIASPMEYSLKEPKGFSRQVLMKGKTPATTWINKSVVPCDKEIAGWLKLEPGSDVFLLKRIRYVDDQAVSIEESWVPAALIDRVEDIDISLYDYFLQRNIRPVQTKSRVSARMPDEDIRSHISLPDNVPILVISQLALDEQATPLEYSISYCRSDMYTFIAE